MSAIDQAFIRAYQTDSPPPAASKTIASASPDLARSGLPPAARVDLAHAIAHTVAPPTERSTAARRLLAEKRPLSTFARPAQTVESRFQPSLEVDHFRWSAACEKLVRVHSDRLEPLVGALLAADDAGRSLIGIGGAARGVGCTTLVACLARLLVAAGKTIAIVDANFASPQLAPQLGVAVQTGWEDVLARGGPLAETVIWSIADRLALLPLAHGGAAAAEKLESIHASVTAGVLRYHYDMVLFDLGPVSDVVQGPIAARVARQCRLDGVLLTTGVNSAASQTPQRLLQTAPELANLCFGLVENQLHAA